MVVVVQPPPWPREGYRGLIWACEDPPNRHLLGVSDGSVAGPSGYGTSPARVTFMVAVNIHRTWNDESGVKILNDRVTHFES